MKQVSAACERNKDPILAVLRRAFSDAQHVLEIGSGTGQHAVHFAQGLPHLVWHTSDLPDYHPSINEYIDESGAPNLRRPFVLDAGRSDSADELRRALAKNESRSAATGGLINIDAVFTANTIQIMSEDEVAGMFSLLKEILMVGGRFCLYSPLQYNGRHSSPGNSEFDAALRARAPQMGVRDFVWLNGLAEDAGLVLEADHDMPANNRMLEYRRA
ncbi:MAG: class I SAM-dependent methyltransferase [bacterium]|nr:class I SAM-dependent methyltransferase [bacterium]